MWCLCCWLSSYRVRDPGEANEACLRVSQFQPGPSAHYRYAGLTLIHSGSVFAPAASTLAPSPGPASGTRTLGASGDAGTAHRRETLVAKPGAQFAVLETLIGIDALLFSGNPHAWGVFAALFMVPSGAAAIADRKANPIEPWLFLAGAGALVVYDLKVDQTRTSQGEIFKTNSPA